MLRVNSDKAVGALSDQRQQSRKRSRYKFTKRQLEQRVRTIPAYAPVRRTARPSRCPGHPVRVESAHPAVPYAIDQLGFLADRPGRPADRHPGRAVEHPRRDFNATLDHGPLRPLLDTGYVDAAAPVGAGLVGTWGPHDGDLIPPVVIDHVLVDRRIAVRDVTVHPLPGSDHRMVLAELRLPAAQR